MESYLNEIDWLALWLNPYKTLGIEISAVKNTREALNKKAEQRNIRNHTNLPLYFIEQHELPDNVAYEAHISATGKVPTRDNLHDFFNALVWLTFPKIKAQLNALQAKQIERLGIGQSRGKARDAATLFDENAALLAVTDTPEGRSTVQALRTHQWNQLFIQKRKQFISHTEVILFGHAMLEKLVRPYKAITAHTIVCWVEPKFFGLSEAEKCALLDQRIANQLEQIELAPAIFSPLPILGVPDWWPNQTSEFYADSSVFRPARARR